MRNVYLVGWLVLALAGRPALAQDFGLDLTGGGDTNATDSNSEKEDEAAAGEAMGSVGLDLSGSVAAADLAPRWVLVGLETPDKAGAAMARRWLKVLDTVARKTNRVSVAGGDKESRQALDTRYEEVLRCGEASCFREAAETLDAELLTTARLALEGRQWVLRLWTYDRDTGTVETDEVEGKSAKDKRLFTKGAEAMAKRLKAMAKPRGLVRISSNVSQAVVRVGDKVLGAGKVEARLPPGEVQVVFEADGYDTVTKPVTVVSGETQELQALLQLAGPAPDGPDEDKLAATLKKPAPSAGGGPGLFGRPALYTALLGLAAVGVGVAVGQGAQSVVGKAVDADGDGVIDLTRRERLAAEGQATLANVLIAGGGAVAAGSALWLVLVPEKSPAPAGSVAPASGPTPGGATTLHLVLGGSF